MKKKYFLPKTRIFMCLQANKLVCLISLIPSMDLFALLLLLLYLFYASHWHFHIKRNGDDSNQFLLLYLQHFVFCLLDSNTIIDIIRIFCLYYRFLVTHFNCKKKHCLMGAWIRTLIAAQSKNVQLSSWEAHCLIHI